MYDSEHTLSPSDSEMHCCVRRQVRKPLIPAWGTMDSKEHVTGTLEDVQDYNVKRWVLQTTEAQKSISKDTGRFKYVASEKHF